ncbi:hypothetical protein HRI_004628500 [Hibiscus trionum]|uniref:BZIP domain-containing protein n=1 Tax=Hibiscus trionum TaxID=183268 RepID=A0A9W7MLQ3_HIBTR|nr:hypothetical protein HRI_004628500 [Hibiscus trionum]
MLDNHSKTLQFSASRHQLQNLKSMFPGDLTGLHYLGPENQILIPDNLNMMHNTIPGFHLNRFSNSQSNSQYTCNSPLPAAHEFVAQSLSTSTSDEPEEHQLGMIFDERKQRRMISNRESARRSRMRKQKHLDELCSQVIKLRNENQSLTDKLNHVSECHEEVVRENARLKEEASELRRMATDTGIGSPFSLALTELEEVPCNTAYLRAEPTTNQSNIANSVDFLY